MLKIMVPKIFDSCFEVSYRKMKVVWIVATIHLTCVIFIDAIFSTITLLDLVISVWHFVKICHR